LLVQSDKALISLVPLCDMITYGCFCSQYIESNAIVVGIVMLF